MSHLIRIFPVCLINLFFLFQYLKHVRIQLSVRYTRLYPIIIQNERLHSWKGRPYQSVHKGAAPITQLRTYTIKTVHTQVKVRNEAKIRNTYNQMPPRTLKEKVTKTKENITYKRAKRSALSQQVTTSLQGTDKLV